MGEIDERDERDEGGRERGILWVKCRCTVVAGEKSWRLAPCVFVLNTLELQQIYAVGLTAYISFLFIIDLAHLCPLTRNTKKNHVSYFILRKIVDKLQISDF